MSLINRTHRVTSTLRVTEFTVTAFAVTVHSIASLEHFTIPFVLLHSSRFPAYRPCPLTAVLSPKSRKIGSVKGLKKTDTLVKARYLLAITLLAVAKLIEANTRRCRSTREISAFAQKYFWGCVVSRFAKIMARLKACAQNPKTPNNINNITKNTKFSLLSVSVYRPTKHGCQSLNPIVLK